MTEPVCKTCTHYRQHYVLDEQRCTSVNCGNCTYPRLKHREPNATACLHYEVRTLPAPFRTGNRSFISSRPSSCNISSVLIFRRNKCGKLPVFHPTKPNDPITKVVGSFLVSLSVIPQIHTPAHNSCHHHYGMLESRSDHSANLLNIPHCR